MDAAKQVTLETIAGLASIILIVTLLTWHIADLVARSACVLECHFASIIHAAVKVGSQILEFHTLSYLVQSESIDLEHKGVVRNR